MVDERLCGNCQAEVPEGHYYCGSCGASYSEDGHWGENETLFYGAMQAPGRAKLILIRGKGLEGLSYLLNSAEHLAGKKSGAMSFPDDPYLNNSHTRFYYRENKLFMRDEHSDNGTYLRIREPRVLTDGDEFIIGEQRLKIEMLNYGLEYPMIDDTLLYVSPPKPFTFRIVQILEGGKPGQAFCVPKNDIVLGREGADLLFADDRYVSEQHAQVRYDNGKVILSDLDSKNGTYVRINQEVQLQHSDYVMLGSQLLRVEINI